MSKEELKNMQFKRGEIYIAHLGDDVIGSEQGGARPVLILQNNLGNRFSPNLICLAITSNIKKKKLPTHVYIDKQEYTDLPMDSIILADQIRTISKERIVSRYPITKVRRNKMKEVEESIKTSLALGWE